MIGAPEAPFRGLRLFAAVLLALQVAAPAAVAFADTPPPANHADHLGTPDDGGCAPFHDEAFCLSCRVLFAPGLGAAPDPAPPVQPAQTSGTLRDAEEAIPDRLSTPRLHARAPPRR